MHACASCHDLIDPVGFALDQYDAVGSLAFDESGRSQPVDADRTFARWPSRRRRRMNLRTESLKRPELFVTALVKKADDLRTRATVNSCRWSRKCGGS